jgi:hypothetical protein
VSTAWFINEDGGTHYAKPLLIVSPPAWGDNVIQLSAGPYGTRYFSRQAGLPYAVYKQLGGSPDSADQFVQYYDALDVTKPVVGNVGIFFRDTAPQVAVDLPHSPTAAPTWTFFIGEVFHSTGVAVNVSGNRWMVQLTLSDTIQTGRIARLYIPVTAEGETYPINLYGMTARRFSGSIPTAEQIQSLESAIGGAAGPGEQTLTVRARTNGLGVAGVRIAVSGAARSETTNTDGVAKLNLASSETPYTIKVTPPTTFEGVDDLTVLVGNADQLVDVPLVVTSLEPPDDEALINVLVTVFTQFGRPAKCAKVAAEVQGYPAFVPDGIVLNTRETATVNAMGQALLQLYRGMTYRITINYAGHAAIVLTREIPLTGDLYAVDGTVA